VHGCAAASAVGGAAKVIAAVPAVPLPAPPVVPAPAVPPDAPALAAVGVPPGAPLPEMRPVHPSATSTLAAASRTEDIRGRGDKLIPLYDVSPPKPSRPRSIYGRQKGGASGSMRRFAMKASSTYSVVGAGVSPSVIVPTVHEIAGAAAIVVGPVTS
jgi:hypothetical protein